MYKIKTDRIIHKLTVFGSFFYVEKNARKKTKTCKNEKTVENFESGLDF